MLLISVLTPLYAREPQAPAFQERLGRWMAALERQRGPLELLIAATSEQPEDPFTPWLASRVQPDYPHAWRVLHTGFDAGASRPQSRAAALNDAAAAARGELLLVLHADSLLPEGGLERVREAASLGWRWGAFPKRYAPSTPLLAFQAAVLNALYLRRDERCVGTNAPWLRRDLW